MNFSTLVSEICALSASTQAATARAVDRLLTLRSWLIGAWIVEYEQLGEDRAAYGEAVVERLAEALGQAGVVGMSSRAGPCSQGWAQSPRRRLENWISSRQPSLTGLQLLPLAA